MKEAIFYLIVALSSLFILGYSVHMFIGGLVSETTEQLVIAIVCTIGALVLAYLAWDVIQRRKNQDGR